MRENMEWSKEKTMKLVELMQMNSSLWNPAVCESRRDKQKRKEELRSIAKMLEMTVADVTKKIQHLRTQYNREAAREGRVKSDDPGDRYVSNWYAFEFLHFLKDSSKPFRVIINTDYNEELSHALQNAELLLNEKRPRSPPRKLLRTDTTTGPIKSDQPNKRDEFSVFGEYVANELRSLKGEKNLLVAKKKIQDAIFDVKMSSMHEACMTTAHAEHAHHVPPALHAPHPPHTPVTNMNEITSIINNCHYSNFKVDQP